MSDLNITLEFSGGAELLVGNQRKHELKLAANAEGASWNVSQLLAYVKETVVTERPELLIQGTTVRPGILVLVNDTDWELLGEGDYELQEGDTVVFISTLHGG